jgi:hypothetical protein
MSTLFRALVLLCLAACASAFSAQPAGGMALRRMAACSPSALTTMAHHVNKKSTKKHNDRRPKKHSQADRNRTPPTFNVNPISAVASTPDFTVVSKSA